jgi:hypothetical protein
MCEKTLSPCVPVWVTTSDALNASYLAFGG